MHKDNQFMFFSFKFLTENLHNHKMFESHYFFLLPGYSVAPPSNFRG